MTHLLLWQLLCNGCLFQLFITFLQSLLHTLDTISLHIAGTDENALERSKAKVIVRLRRQLFLTQSEINIHQHSTVVTRSVCIRPG